MARQIFRLWNIVVYLNNGSIIMYSREVLELKKKLPNAKNHPFVLTFLSFVYFCFYEKHLILQLVQYINYCRLVDDV